MQSKSKVRLIVLTGCSRGLGRALAEFFATDGATVLGCARSREGVEDLRASLGKPHDFVVADVADDAQVRWWAERALASYGTPDLLINNAGVIASNAPLWEVSPTDVSRTLETNIGGTIAAIRHFVPPMIANGHGVIVNISSGWGRSVAPQVATYCATKWAIEGLTRALAKELPRGLATVALNPGIIDTEMLRSCFGDEASGYPKPTEWAKLAGPFILSLGAKHNGRSVDVPGVPTE